MDGGLLYDLRPPKLLPAEWRARGAGFPHPGERRPRRVVSSRLKQPPSQCRRRGKQKQEESGAQPAPAFEVFQRLGALPRRPPQAVAPPLGEVGRPRMVAPHVIAGTPGRGQGGPSPGLPRT
ncbi:unnamed protein product, partial [Amoebophrya sp. A120]|eukprot:GSA120T00012961001.1